MDELFADDIRAHIAGNHALSGDYQGKKAVFGFFAAGSPSGREGRPGSSCRTR